MLGDGADDVALGEHAGRGIALGADDILDHQRADIAGAHQLSGDSHGFIHSNRRDAGSFLAQDVFDFHCLLLHVSRRERFLLLRLVYIIPIVNLISEENRRQKTAVTLTFCCLWRSRWYDRVREKFSIGILYPKKCRIKKRRTDRHASLRKNSSWRPISGGFDVSRSGVRGGLSTEDEGTPHRLDDEQCQQRRGGVEPDG